MTEPLTEDQLEQVRAAGEKVAKALRADGLVSMPELIAELTKPPEPRLRDRCPVIDALDKVWRSGHAAQLYAEDEPAILPLITLITTDEAREIARRVLMRYVSQYIDDAMAEVDRDLTAYTTEPSDE